MLEVQEIEEVEINVRRLGFANAIHYAKSTLYQIIKEEVFKRDHGKCRKIGCANPAKCLGFINIDKKTLSGMPFNIFSLCSSCYNRTKIVAPPNSELFMLNQTFFLVSGMRKVKGKTNKDIGDFYASQRKKQANLDCYQLIRERIFTLPPGNLVKVREVWLEQEEEKEENS